MATIAIVVDGRGLGIDTHLKNLTNKSLLALYKALVLSNSCLNQVYLSKKMVHFSYKGGCGVHGHTRIEAIKRRDG